jgi:hypothetical protein
VHILPQEGQGNFALWDEDVEAVVAAGSGIGGNAVMEVVVGAECKGEKIGPGDG